MTRYAVLLTVTGTFVLLSAATTTSLADTGSCRDSDGAALRAYLHDPEIHVPDGLSNYSSDLSAYGMPRPTVRVSRAPQPETATRPALDMVALRAYFHSGAFQSSDGLANYSDDYRAYDTPPREDQIAMLVQGRP